jgi:hypothetical protein
VVKVVLFMMMMGKIVRQQGAVAFTRQTASSRNGFVAGTTLRKTLQRQFPLYFPSIAVYSTTPTSASDRSAISKSRMPFRMPTNSPDDSAISKDTLSSSSSSLSWNRLGLLTELCDCLKDELRLSHPTPVQSLVIPQLLLQQAATQGQKESLAFLAATG